MVIFLMTTTNQTMPQPRQAPEEFCFVIHGVGLSKNKLRIGGTGAVSLSRKIPIRPETKAKNLILNLTSAFIY
jgi:hypothetical protein